MREGEQVESHRTSVFARSQRIFVALSAAAILIASCSGGGGTSGGTASTASGKVALLLPEKQTARYEAADRPFFETKFKAVCPASSSSTATRARARPPSSSRPRPR